MKTTLDKEKLLDHLRREWIKSYHNETNRYTAYLMADINAGKYDTKEEL